MKMNPNTNRDPKMNPNPNANKKTGRNCKNYFCSDSCLDSCSWLTTNMTILSFHQCVARRSVRSLACWGQPLHSYCETSNVKTCQCLLSEVYRAERSQSMEEGQCSSLVRVIMLLAQSSHCPGYQTSDSKVQEECWWRGSRRISNTQWISQVSSPQFEFFYLHDTVCSVQISQVSVYANTWDYCQDIVLPASFNYCLFSDLFWTNCGR